MAEALTKHPTIKRGTYKGLSGLAKAADNSMGPIKRVKKANTRILIPSANSFLSVLFFVMIIMLYCVSNAFMCF